MIQRSKKSRFSKKESGIFCFFNKNNKIAKLCER